jgi:hypothetical protein
MEMLLAKQIIKNKFWIVENHGKKIATIQTIDETGGAVYVQDQERSYFPSVKLLGKNHNIVFDKQKKIEKPPIKQNMYDVYGYPSSFKPYNLLYDVRKKLPIFTKTDKSKSYFCSGYYLIKFSTVWTKAFCPKLITLQRYEFVGPFETKEETTEQARVLNTD